MKILLILTALILSVGLKAQTEELLPFEELENAFLNTSLEEALIDPKNVVRLDLSKSKLLNLDYDFRKFVNLQWLDLSNNDLTSFPVILGELSKLQYLDISKNKIDKVPDEIGKLVNLKELYLSKNKIYSLSPEMGKLKKLEKIDMWDNPIKTFPEELRNMSALKDLDLRVTVINEAEKKKLIKMFPDAKIKFSKSCNCN